MFSLRLGRLKQLYLNRRDMSDRENRPLQLFTQKSAIASLQFHEKKRKTIFLFPTCRQFQRMYELICRAICRPEGQQQRVNLTILSNDAPLEVGAVSASLYFESGALARGRD